MSSRAQKIAAQRAAAQRATTRRRRLMIGAGSIGLVIVLIVAFIVIKANQSPARALGSGSDPQITREIASVSAATFNQVGTGNAAGLKAISGPALTSGGKPEVLYIGGEFCPYCAAERWALATALSRFGTLTVTHLIHSSPTDSYANTPTLSFAGSSYTSKYLTFTPVEWYGEQTDASTPFGHVYLEQPTAQEESLFNQYGGNSIPFVDIGNRYTLPAAQYLPSDLSGLTWAQIAADLHDPSSTVAKDIDGAANILTAALCKVTTGPAGLCSSAGVQAASNSL